MTLFPLFWLILAFVFGALPFSVWFGKLFLRQDVRSVGDSNPGATNAWKMGGWRLGFPVLLLDFLKGAIPVGIAYQVWGWEGALLLAVSLAPILGHDFSPFLGGRGGKGLATTFGVWTGLTLAEAPVILGVSMALLLWLRVRDGWAIVFSLLVLLLDLILRPHPPIFLMVWFVTTALLIWTYRQKLHPPVRHARSQRE